MARNNQQISRLERRNINVDEEQFFNVLDSIVANQEEGLASKQDIAVAENINKSVTRQANKGNVFMDYILPIIFKANPFLNVASQFLYDKHRTKDLGKGEMAKYKEHFGDTEMGRELEKGFGQKADAIVKGGLYSNILSQALAPIKNKALEGLSLKEKLAKLDPFKKMIKPGTGVTTKILDTGKEILDVTDPSKYDISGEYVVDIATGEQLGETSSITEDFIEEAIIDDPSKGLHNLFASGDGGEASQRLNDLIIDKFKLKAGTKVVPPMFEKNPALLQLMLREYIKGGMQ